MKKVTNPPRTSREADEPRAVMENHRLKDDNFALSSALATGVSPGDCETMGDTL
ncbi:hypothetical protein [Propionibacterium freudenreichii]|uniref:hypothetical protein n=1 Tax=Propionibacterium freudenreichii TaxID=1744 RepID=UPI001E5225EF|nr:hypothetical protein [Propionibacterium freudenreichii]